MLQDFLCSSNSHEHAKTFFEIFIKFGHAPSKIFVSPLVEYRGLLRPTVLVMSQRYRLICSTNV